MKTYTFEERRPKIPGPWMEEPDKAQWIDTVTGLDCLIVRNHMGGLCGYAGVMPGHPWHEKQYDEVELPEGVHGGLTYADYCMEGAEDGPGVCHIPEPGRPANVWWLGFDCGHINDVMPGMLAFERPEVQTLEQVQQYLKDELTGDRYFRKTYKSFPYVIRECASLALQIHKAGKA